MSKMSFLICTRTLGPLAENVPGCFLGRNVPRRGPLGSFPLDPPLQMGFPFNLAAELSGSSSRLKSATGRNDAVPNASAPEHYEALGSLNTTHCVLRIDVSSDQTP